MVRRKTVRPTRPHGYWSPSHRYIYWERVIARAQALPGTWFLAFPASPVSIANTVRRRRTSALRGLASPLKVEVRNEYTDPDGTRLGDVYIRMMSEE